MRRPPRVLAETFAYPGVAEAYRYRPPYPEAVFEILSGLVQDTPGTALDLGAGEGAIARRLASLVDRVDAIDPSAAMIDAGRARPGGDRPNLRWILGAAESCELHGPYALVVAGASFHWMDWSTVLGRLCTAMTGHAVLAIVEHGVLDPPWQEPLVEVISRFSRNPDHDPRFDIRQALVSTGRFELLGTAETDPAPFAQRVDEYVEQFHSTASLARELMDTGEADRFHDEIVRIVRPYASEDILDLRVAATILWGRPTRAA